MWRGGVGRKGARLLFGLTIRDITPHYNEPGPSDGLGVALAAGA